MYLLIRSLPSPFTSFLLTPPPHYPHNTLTTNNVPRNVTPSASVQTPLQMFFSTFSSYYVFRSRLETRSEFPSNLATNSVALNSIFTGLNFHSILIRVYMHCFTLFSFKYVCFLFVFLTLPSIPTSYSEIQFPS